MGIFRRIKKGARAAKMAMREPETFEKQMDAIIQSFLTSKERKLMFTGDSYYRVENIEIMNRDMIRVVDGKKIDESYKSNNQLAHGNYHNQVDEKVNYLLSKEYTLDCEDKTYLKKVQGVLTDYFKNKLLKVGYEASNKGIAWLHPYINEVGEFCFMIVPSEECCPIWENNDHETLSAMYRVFDSVSYEEGKKKIRTHIEVWTSEGFKCYIKDGDLYTLNVTKSLDDVGSEVSHFKDANGQQTSWGRVPFIPIKNNFIEMPDIQFVKTLIDGYDKSRSEAANYVEDTKNLIMILKGYAGKDIDELMYNINVKRAVALDADTDEEKTGVEALTPTMDITALREHYEQLKRDITETGQSVLKDIDKFGSTPSGIALGFMYSGLDLKTSAMEMHMKIAFANLMYFVNEYLNIQNAPKVTITFNRNMKMDEKENLEKCQLAKNLELPEEDWLPKCAWVTDFEKTKKSMKKYREENQPFQDHVPLPTKKVTDGSKE